MQVCFSVLASYPGLHRHPPPGRYQLPSPLQRYFGGESSTALATHTPLACSIDVTSRPVGVAGNTAKLAVTSGQVM